MNTFRPHSARVARAVLAFAVFVLSSLWLTTCGGGGGGGSTGPVSQPVPLAITTASLPDGIDGVQYHQTLKAVGGRPPYAWSLASGNLPDGISLSATLGSVEGTPTKDGRFKITVQVQDRIGQFSQPASFAVSLNRALRMESPPAGIFDDREIGPIMVNWETNQQGGAR